VLECVKSLGVNTLALSNNHSWDLGTDGIIAHRNAVKELGFVHAGTGDNLHEATAPAIIETDNGRVAVVSMASGMIRRDAKGRDRLGFATFDRAGVNELEAHLQPDGEYIVDPMDSARILAAIETARHLADCVIVYHHNHYAPHREDNTPEWIRNWARLCVDSGANVYISDGAPLARGAEVYKGAPLLYSLGSFIFQTRTEINYYDFRSWESVVADLVFDPQARRLRSVNFYPICLNEQGELPDAHYQTRGRPRLAQGKVGSRILKRFQSLSSELGATITVNNGIGCLMFD